MVKIGIDFYSELLTSKVFCENLGRLILTSGKLESSLKCLLKSNGESKNLERFTLGMLISKCKKGVIVDQSLLELLDFIKKRRNYLAHSLFPLFNEEIEETLLPRENLEVEDVEWTFAPRVESLIIEMDAALNMLSEYDT